MSNYELTDEAKSLMQTDPKTFRKAYGDYFVAGVKKGSQFIAVYNMRASSRKQLDQFKSELGLNATDKIEANSLARFESTASQNNINYDIDVLMDGYTGAYQRENKEKWDPQEVLRALDWFRQNEYGKPYLVKLLHYSNIAPTYPRTIERDPEVFQELSALYTNLWKVRATWDAIPQFYRDRPNPQFSKKETLEAVKTRFEKGVINKREALATNMSLRKDLTNDGQELLGELRAINGRRAFFEEVKASMSSEPRPGNRFNANSLDQKFWSYGYTPHDQKLVRAAEAVIGAVEIKSEERTFARNWVLGRRHEETLGIKDPEKRIVGWTVISHWGGKGQHNGEWWKVTDPSILLTTDSAVRVRSEETRGCNWGVIYYYVKASDYRFD
jgi:hypothetical protein